MLGQRRVLPPVGFRHPPLQSQVNNYPVSLFALAGGLWVRQGAVQTPVTMGAGRAQFNLDTSRLAVAGYRPLGADFADVYRIEEVR